MRRACMFNDNNKGIMVTAKIGKHIVEYYDTIEELPIVRFHKYQKLLLIDAGIGSDVAALDHRLERARRFIKAGKPEQAEREIENLRQCFHFITEGVSPKHLAFAALVAKIDGKECTDISDGAIEGITKTLGDAPTGKIAALLEAVKKKIDAELMLYFPALFNDSEVKEYYDLLRRRTLEVLNGIAEGLEKPDGTAVVDALTTKLMTYSHPKLFAGPEGAEVQFEKQFEDLCLALGESLRVEAKRMSVLEFYNAFVFAQQKARNGQKEARRTR